MKTREKGESWKKKRYIVIWGIVWSLPVIIKLLLGEWATVPTSSMVPTILPGDLIWYEKYSYGAVMPTKISECPLLSLLCLIPSVRKEDKQREWGYRRLPGFGKPERMDVIVFRNPQNRNQLLTKRVIGLPGDTISILRGRVYINRILINDIGGHQIGWRNVAIGFPKNKRGVWTTQKYGPLPIPQNERNEEEDCYFVMGDERENSLDSRYIGFIPYRDIEGRVSCILYSPEGSENGKEVFFRRLD